MKTNPNDPAFPEAEGSSNGMTIREYFAARAMQGFLTSGMSTEVLLGRTNCLAQISVAAADLLIAELNKTVPA